MYSSFIVYLMEILDSVEFFIFFLFIQIDIQRCKRQKENYKTNHKIAQYHNEKPQQQRRNLSMPSYFAQLAIQINWCLHSTSEGDELLISF